MLKKSHRIRLESEYKRVFSKGQKVYSPFFILFVTPAEPDSIRISKIPTRFGFIASKKVGKAVDRNRAKRVIREIIRLNLININKGFEVVIILSPKIVGQTYSVLENEILNSLKKANLIKTLP